MSDPAPALNLVDAEHQAVDCALAVAVFSVDGTALRANANFLKLFGYRTRELIGQPHAILLPHGTAPEPSDFWASLRQGATQRVVGPRLRKDGAALWVDASYTPVGDLDGQVARIVMLATDVSAEQRCAADLRGQVDAIDATQAVVHFTLDGTVTHANARFLAAMGLCRDEVIGMHHRLFVGADEAEGPAHLAFWQALAAGRAQAGTFRRLGKHGCEVWLDASYHPILGLDGRPSKVVSYATDVTAERTRRADHEGQIAAIDTSHAVITFDMHGTVLDANRNFLDAFGYRLDEVEGRHHRMFVEPSHAHGPEYAAFWNGLAEGRHQSGEYRRYGKDGREVWLQASYNPIRDLNGHCVKVVKYATVVTHEKRRQADHQGQIASIHKVQCIISFALDGTILDANDNFLDATGYRLSEVRGRHHRMFVDAATAGGADYAAFWSDLARGRHRAGEFKRLGKDGSELWLQASYNPIFDSSGRPFKVVKYATNVTQERLRQADSVGQIAAIHKSQCVVAFDLDGHVLEANDNFLAAVGYARDEVVGQHHRLFVDPAVAQGTDYRAFWDTLRSGGFVSELCRRVGQGGREVWLQASYNPILDLNGRPFKVVKIATDVSASVALAAQVVSARLLAEHDSTTGLPNRLGLKAFMDAAFEAPAKRLALLYLDLDHFKPINDTFGHAIGDQVLKETATRLRETLRPGQMVARIGGDEFVVAALDLADEQIDALCQRLLDVVKAPIRHANRALTVGLSIGVAVSPGDATTGDDLLRCADIALYRRKGNGRDGYSCFALSMHERLSANRHLADEMRHGIQAGQFFLEFRPRHDARTGAAADAEALVVWRHPVRGRVDQAEFLTLAEKSALILPLAEWVLRDACQAAVGWTALGVVVDVSPVQFAGTDLAALVGSVLAESGLAPRRLTLSMPERVLTDDADRARAGLVALKALGVRLLLSGDGSHSASLQDLRNFGFDDVTIDHALVADIEAEEGGRPLAREIRQLGDLLGTPAAGPLLLTGLGAAGAVRGLRLGTPGPASALQAPLAAVPDRVSVPA